MRNYIDEISKGFWQMGYQPIVLDALDSSYDQLYEQVIQSYKIDIIFTCNAILYSETQNITGARYVTYLCDHPSENRDRLQKLGKDAVVFVCDMFHVQYIQKYYPNIKNVSFIPLSGSYCFLDIPYQKRKYDVVFTGSYANPEKLYQNMMLQYEGVLNQFVQSMIRQLENNPNYTIEHCLKIVLEQNRVSVSDEEFNELTEEFFCVSHYARFYYRDCVMRILVENGIQVHVFGNGWEDFEGLGKDNLILENGNEIIAREAVANAKISLNVMPWFKAGFQERIATAMLSETVALTDESMYINENFTNKELCTYALDNLIKLPELVQTLLENEEDAAQIAKNGKKRADAELTWQYRAKQMIHYIEGLEEKNEY